MPFPSVVYSPRGKRELSRFHWRDPESRRCFWRTGTCWGPRRAVWGSPIYPAGHLWTYTPLLYSLQLQCCIRHTLYWFIYLCMERQETLEWWLRSRRLPCAVAPPPCREWEWEWAETWCLCPTHWPAPSAPSSPVARLRTAWRHAVQSLQPAQTDTESSLGENSETFTQILSQQDSCIRAVSIHNTTMTFMLERWIQK